MDVGSFVEVVLPLAVPSLLYKLPQGIRAEVGKRVLVSLRGKARIGVILEVLSSLPPDLDPGRLKEVMEVEEGPPLLGPKEVSLMRWAAHHYLSPLGLALKCALPPTATARAQPRLRATEEAERLLREGRIGGVEREVLEALKGRSLTLKALLRRFPLEVLEGLQRGGLLRSEERPPWRRRGEPWVALVHLPSLEGFTPKERDLLTFLKEVEEAPLRELKRRRRGVKGTVERLVQRGVLRVFHRDLPFSFAFTEVAPSPRPHRLTPEQEVALSSIRRGLEGNGGAYLLHGVTGSGKTEVYLRAAEAALAAGKGALVLVPEISLTPQLFTRFRRRLGEEVALLHSAMTRQERYEQWRRIAAGEMRVVIGARSALFAPIRDLGLIVVDEEHDPSYKQSDGLRYNARDVALVRGRLEGATVVLGSATPSVETYYNASKGRISLLQLRRRVDDRPLPTVEVVDLKGQRGVLSGPLREALRETVSRGEQALLFLNRRGFAPVMTCRDCGEPLRCKYCSVTLTYHASSRNLLCHYCGFSLPVPQICPRCGGKRVFSFGFGTERVAEEVRRLLPRAQVARMDSDTVTTRRDYEALLRALAEGEIDVLVGTQMIVKGHDVPHITLVGVICADVALNLPDFRAPERTFQLLSQAAGRAGRGDREGRVIVQTLLPGHYAVLKASRHDFEGFFGQEIALRRELLYPPFCRLIQVRFTGADLRQVKARAHEVARALEGGDFQVLGPAPAPLFLLRGRWRWQLLLKGRSYTPMREALREVISRGERRGVRVEVDVDPLSMI